MAGKRITKSLIDWAAFAERVGPHEKLSFQAFKARSDGYLRKMMSYPENPPQIDWSFYKSKIAAAGLVDELEKAYKGVKISYPKDPLTAQINVQEKETEKEVKEFIEGSNLRIKQYEKHLNWYKELKPFEDMTMEDYYEAFPSKRVDPNNPTFWPHDEPVPEGYIKPAKHTEDH